MVTPPRRFEVYLVALDPTVGSEINKVRPAVVVSPDHMNHRLNTCLMAPMTTAARKWPSRVPVSFGGREGQVALDQLRAIDRQRLMRRLGEITPQEAQAVLQTLARIFSP